MVCVQTIMEWDMEDDTGESGYLTSLQVAYKLRQLMMLSWA